MDDFKRQVVGAIRSAIDAHGPITDDNADSAGKRIANAIQADIKTERDRLMTTQPKTRDIEDELQRAITNAERSEDPALVAGLTEALKIVRGKRAKKYRQAT